MPTSRRQFLQSTGVAASTLAMSQAATGAQEPAKPISANDRVQIGCIGFGIMGQGDMKTESSLPGVEIVAVSDVYDGRRTLAQERYGKHVLTTRDYRELLARRDVDAVIVATPDHWHARIATDALHAGKDVYCQKPMVREVPDGHMVIEAQKQTDSNTEAPAEDVRRGSECVTPTVQVLTLGLGARNEYVKAAKQSSSLCAPVLHKTVD